MRTKNDTRVDATMAIAMPVVSNIFDFVSAVANKFGASWRFLWGANPHKKAPLPRRVRRYLA